MKKHLEPTWRWALALACAYAIVTAVASCLNEAAFGNSAYDFGEHIQAIWKFSTWQGFFNTIRGLNIWGDHTWFIMPLFAIPYSFFPSPYLLLAIQSIVIASGAVAVFLLARTFKASAWWALALSAAYLLYPSTTNMVMENFHTEIADCALLLWAFVFLERKRRVGYWIFLVLALACKEDVSLAVAAFGLYVFVKHDRLTGALTTLVAIAWFIVSIQVVLPLMNGSGFFLLTPGGRYSGLAGGWSKPSFYWTILSDPRTWLYLLTALGPLAFLPVLAPLEFLPALAPILFNILSRNPYQLSGRYHYEAVAIPFLFLALARVVTSTRWQRMARPAAILLFGSLVLGSSLNSTFRWTSFRDNWFRLRSMDVRQRQVAIALVPKDPDVSVSASHLMVTKLANRNRIYFFPNPWEEEYWAIHGENSHRGFLPDYIVLDRHDFGRNLDGLIRKIQAGGAYRQIYGAGKVMVLKKN